MWIGGSGNMQRGHIYEGDCRGKTYFYIRYLDDVIVDGQTIRKQVSKQLVEKHSPAPGGGIYEKTRAGKPNEALRILAAGVMQEINERQRSSKRQKPESNMSVADFWEKVYLPYCEEIVAVTGKSRMKPSTVRGYKQIWNSHLKNHFGKITLREYEPSTGRQLLRSLVNTQNSTSIKHVKSVASSIFSHAVDEEVISMNPWRDVKVPKDAIQPENTQHYTVEESEDLISALVDHVDCQLVIALACFLGLRPGEIAALKWEDFDTDCVHIRRSVWRTFVGTPKTAESVSDIPLVDDRIKVPLELWRQKSGQPKSGWVFPNEKGTPVNIENLKRRVIMPHVTGDEECIRCKKTPEKSTVEWKALYSGRRGACTAVIESTSRAEIAQALLRHKSMQTTLDFYKKQISSDAFREGLRQVAAATTKRLSGIS